MKVKKTFGRTIRVNQDQVDRLKQWENQLLKLKSKTGSEQGEVERDNLKSDKNILRGKEEKEGRFMKNTTSEETLVELLGTCVEELTIDALSVIETTESGRESVSFDLVSTKSIDDLLALCNQPHILNFEDYFDVFPSKKIGEASYSDVYISKTNQAIKIIPIENTNQLTIHAAWLELATTKQIGSISQRNENVCNFVQLERSGVVQGSYHPDLIDLWDRYDEIHESENIDPREYSATQFYLILSMEYAGSDLENTFLVSNLHRVYSLLLQTILSLCQAEIQLGFEHRDLHWGNILVCSYKKSNMPFVIPFSKGTQTIVVPTGMIKITLIDFTLARFCHGVIC
jgi:hypothetical protein